MSKKKPLDQLSRLFAAKELTINDCPEASMQPSGWSWELDNEHRYLFCDPEVRQTLGYSSESLIGKPLESIGIAHDSIPTVKFIFNEDLFPVEVDVFCISQNGKQIPARLTIFKKVKIQIKEGDTFSWSGFTQPLMVSKPNGTQAKNLSDLKGSNKTQVRTIKSTGLPAELSGKNIRDLPLAVHEENTPEVTDEDHEVSEKLTSPDKTLRVENLSGEILDSKLTATDNLLTGLIDKIKKPKDEQSIYNLLDEFLYDSLEIDDYAFIHFDQKQKLLLFPISRVGGVANQPDAIPMGIDLYSWAVINRDIVEIQSDFEEFLSEKGLPLPPRIPRSFISIPIAIEDKNLGTLIVQSFENDFAFDNSQVDLLNKLALPVANALNNAYAYDDIFTAITKLDVRQRYLTNLVKAVDFLTNPINPSIQDFLECIGSASQCDQVFVLSIDPDGWSGSITAFWEKEIRISNPLMKDRAFPWEILNQCLSRGENCQYLILDESHCESSEHDLLTSIGLKTALVLNASSIENPNTYLLLGQFRLRDWQSDEIELIQVAADTLIQVISRDKIKSELINDLKKRRNILLTTQELLKAQDSHEVLNSLINGIQFLKIDHADLIKKDFSSSKTNFINAASYPLSASNSDRIFSEIDPTILQRYLYTENPLFIENTDTARIHPEIKRFLILLHIKSIALLPLWYEKKQIGAVLLSWTNPQTFSIEDQNYCASLCDSLATSLYHIDQFEVIKETYSASRSTNSIIQKVLLTNKPHDIVDILTQDILPANADRIMFLKFTYDDDEYLIDYEIIANQTRDHQNIWPKIRESINSFPALRSIQESPLIFSSLDSRSLDPRSIDALIRYDIQSGIILPLEYSGKVIGALAVTACEPTEFLREEVHLIEAVGAWLPVIFQRQNALELTRSHLHEVECLSEILDTPSKIQTFPELLHEILDLIRIRFGYYHSAIYLINKDNTNAEIADASGAGSQALLRSSLKYLLGSRTLIGKVISGKSPLFINDISSSRLFQANPFLPETRSEAVMPLMVGEKVIGALDIHSSEPDGFQHNNSEFLKNLSDIISIIIENCKANVIVNDLSIDTEHLRIIQRNLQDLIEENEAPSLTLSGFSQAINTGFEPISSVSETINLSSLFHSTHKLLDWLQKMLALVQIEIGKKELHKEEIDFFDLISQTTSQALPIIAGKSIVIRNFIDRGLPVVLADRSDLQFVIFNLVSNAINFTEKGTITIDANHNIARNGRQEVMVTITDSGVGIPEKDRADIFQPLIPRQSGYHFQAGSPGLSLALCKAIIELHGGQLGITWSKVGRGSAFYFTLPALNPDVSESKLSTAQLT